ncbi:MULTISPECIES: hypothetical protein [Bacillaceae]|uniref:hypothetical protein n=1 Tax=Bacillaceae TaxID=186817 RepID=UPI0011433647|nr:hypothetical protein [Bacillus sp. AFS096315]
MQFRKGKAVEKTATQMRVEKKRRFRQPDAYVLLFFVALIYAIAAYILSARIEKIQNGDITIILKFITQ